jgi:hypothetical protein
MEGTMKTKNGAERSMKNGMRKPVLIAVEVQTKEQAKLVELGLKDPALLAATAALGWLSTFRDKKQRKCAYELIVSKFSETAKARRAA